MAKPATKTPSERTAESRAVKIANGYAQKNWLLPPAALRDLAKITKRDGCSETDAVARALAHFADPHAQLNNTELARLVSVRLTGRG